ncbi:MAG: GerAB/ArcD/ProY family transporter, partial [Cohnella sp.]|nr:GerAB/ArcD/ProY family transporter [Cohnella sp.]
MKAVQIRAVQMFFILALAIGLKNHVIIVPLILNAAMRDAWISAILAIPLVLIWAAVIHKVMKLLNKESLYGWFSARYNKFVACSVIMPIVLMLVMSLYITVRDSCTWTKVTYLPNTPFLVTVTLFVLASMVGAMKGLRTIAIASGLLLPGVILFGLFVMNVNIQFKDYSYLLPILSKGFDPVFRGTLYVLSGAVELIIILAFAPYIKG